MNKLLLILTLLISISILVSGQETKKVNRKSLKGHSIERYYVTQSGVKHGEYKRYWRSKLVVEGVYNYGEKEIFKYYSFDKSPSLVYDFSQDSVLVFVEQDNFGEAYSESGENLIVDRIPLPLFSHYELGWFIATFLNYPKEAMEKGQSGEVLILVSIDENGNASNYSLFWGINKLLNEEALRVVNLIPEEWKWIPAIKDGKPVKSAVVLPVNFKIIER